MSTNNPSAPPVEPSSRPSSRLGMGRVATVFPVLLAISFCHLLNDMNQSLLVAIYPILKTKLALSFGEVGLVTLTFQATASVLQPAVGLFADRRPQPYSLMVGMGFTLVGLFLLATASRYSLLLAAAAMIGVGSSVYHPESAGGARLAAGRRPGLAQAVFQVGGNSGQALGPLLAAFVVVARGQGSIVWFSLGALLAATVLFFVGRWYKRHGMARLGGVRRVPGHLPAPESAPSRRTVRRTVGLLLLLIFSKHIYMSSMSSYYTFFLIHKFHVSVADAQIHLFVFLGATAVGTFLGGPLGDRFGRKFVIWFSILGVLPFTLMLPYADLTWTGILSVIIGVVLASAFPAIVVFGQELMPGRVGTISGLFFGFAFGMAGIGAAALGQMADAYGIDTVYRVCAFLPVLGLFAAFLPDLRQPQKAEPEPA